jgi:hypothetical protein
MPKTTALALAVALLAVGVVFIVALDNLWIGLAFILASTLFDLLFIKAVVDEARAKQKR